MQVLIVGGGIVGLLTAVECVRSGQHVTVVDQDSLPNVAATSHDRSRVLRALHPDDAGATTASVAAHRRWLAWQHTLGIRCYHSIGALSLVPTEQADDHLALLAAAGAPARALDSTELARRYPHLALPAGRIGILEQHAGVLLADRVLAASVGWLRTHPRARLCEGRPAVSVDAATRSVLMGDGTVLRGDCLLVAAGPWSRRLLSPVVTGNPVLYRQTMLYCGVPDAARPHWASTPAIPALGTEQGAWLVPPAGSAPLKLSSHEACRAVPDVASRTSDPCWIDRITARFHELIHGFAGYRVIETRDCYYLDDPVTGGSNLVDMAAGALAFTACGGGSFKHAPLIAAAVMARFTGNAIPETGLEPIDRPRPMREESPT